MKTDVIIPARNEEDTIGPIVQAFRDHEDIGCITVVVDQDTTDRTAIVAQEVLETREGAFTKGLVLTHPLARGKGQCINVGMTFVGSRDVILCDADLSGFRKGNIDLLLRPHFNGMVIGIPDFTPNVPWAREGYVWNWLAGNRRVPTSIMDRLDLHGYCVEVQINSACKQAGIPVRHCRFLGVKGKVRPYDKRIAEMNRDFGWLREHIDQMGKVR